MDCKVGDTVHLSAKVTRERDADGQIRVKMTHEEPNDSSGFYVDIENIVAVVPQPRPIAEGEIVRRPDAGSHMGRMEVYAIRGGQAWCGGEGYHYVIPVGELERVT